MDKEKQKKFTQYITLGWWLSFTFFILQSVVIAMFNICATPIVGFIVFTSFVILSFSSYYDKNYEFSPYKNFMKIFAKRNTKKEH